MAEALFSAAHYTAGSTQARRMKLMEMWQSYESLAALRRWPRSALTCESLAAALAALRRGARSA